MNINAIIAQYNLQTSWYLNALESITEEESNISFSENLNPIKWVAGHLTDSRITIINIISDNAINADYKKLFGKGTSNKIDASFPTIEQIKTDWTNISEQLRTSLQNLPNEKLLLKPPFQTSIPDETLFGLIAYFAIHESFHIGQLSVYRKLTGKPAMNMGRH
ncbi:MAG: hypothetical protein HJHJAOHD_02192 [Flavobacteriales bacterium]|jgi:uncharacterized damage-inducible protein DinB|nr:hypothetical protein [Flavobacteriales bacterium]WKZ76106.1 MAG: DinB family protein [Vicingaceae bacterium]